MKGMGIAAKGRKLKSTVAQAELHPCNKEPMHGHVSAMCGIEPCRNRSHSSDCPFKRGSNFAMVQKMTGNTHKERQFT